MQVLELTPLLFPPLFYTFLRVTQTLLILLYKILSLSAFLNYVFCVMASFSFCLCCWFLISKPSGPCIQSESLVTFWDAAQQPLYRGSQHSSAEAGGQKSPALHLHSKHVGKEKCYPIFNLQVSVWCECICVRDPETESSTAGCM